MPGGGVEPPRAEARRILSPLRLPVPPSRLYLQVPDSTLYILICSFLIHDTKCETVPESVKVFEVLHRSRSLAQEPLRSPSLAKMPLGQVLRGHPSDILPPIALTAPYLNHGLAPVPGDVRVARKYVFLSAARNLGRLDLGHGHSAPASSYRESGHISQ